MAGASVAVDVMAVRALVERYFAAMDTSDFEAALDCFSDDVFYSHPPYHHEPSGSPRHEMRGREELRGLLLDRGPKPWFHVVDTVAVGERGRAFIEGRTIVGEDCIGSFVSVGNVSEDAARFTWYAAYYSAPPVSGLPA